MALCGIVRIDDLYGSAVSANPIGPGDPDKAAVQVIQSLLAGQGQQDLPNLLSPDYGIFGELTAAAVESFRAQQALPAGSQVDSRALRALVQTPAPVPLASRGYLTLALDFEYSGLAKILSVVAQMEGAGNFGALNLNTDRAGLSYGIIQWAQKPGRLGKILKSFRDANENDFVRIFAAGDASLAEGLIGHTSQAHGGVDASSGQTTDPAFDLVSEPWISRFREAALWKPFQQAQVQAGLGDFRSALARIRRYAPQLNSERAVGFLLDLSNQFGEAGARSIFESALRPGMTEAELLQAMANESVERVQDPWKTATEARRRQFLTTDFLSDSIFDDLFYDLAARRKPPTNATPARADSSDKIASS